MDKVEYLVRLIEEKNRIFVLTGAGVSTESGIPDFRGEKGLYTEYPEYVFDIDYFRKDPSLFYEVTKKLLPQLLDAEPNPAHKLVYKLEEMGKLLLVATQNIDGLHQKAGNKKVVELHGSYKTSHCLKCGKEFSFEDLVTELENVTVPKCECGGVIKPDVVFFGEPLPQDALIKAQEAAKKATLCIVMGSSLVVYPAAYLPLICVQEKVPLVIINKGETALDSFASLKIEKRLSKFCESVLKLL